MEIYNQKIYIGSELFKQGRELSRFEQLLVSWQVNFSKFCPSLGKILNSENEYNQLKRISFYLLGTVYSCIIYFFSIHQIELVSQEIKTAIFLTMTLLISTTMSYFMQIRCVLSLVVFNFASSAGKIMLTSYVIINILSGPIQNTVGNVNEMSESLKCQFAFNRNMSKMMKPRNRMSMDLMQTIQARTTELNEQQQEVSKLSNTIYRELNSSDSTKNQDSTQTRDQPTKSKQYYEKNMRRCEKPFQSAQKSCENIKSQMLETCRAGSYLGMALCPLTDLIYGKDCNVESLDKEGERNSKKMCESHLDESEFVGLDENLRLLGQVDAQFAGDVSIELGEYDTDFNKHKLLNKGAILKLQVI
jgi:hypothetical protein